ncbi:hypothetical protein ACHAXN_001603 [Cyclotella atomus]
MGVKSLPHRHDDSHPMDLLNVPGRPWFAWQDPTSPKNKSAVSSGSSQSNTRDICSTRCLVDSAANLPLHLSLSMAKNQTPKHGLNCSLSDTSPSRRRLERLPASLKAKPWMALQSDEMISPILFCSTIPSPRNTTHLQCSSSIKVICQSCFTHNTFVLMEGLFAALSEIVLIRLPSHFPQEQESLLVLAKTKSKVLSRTYPSRYLHSWQLR